MNDLIHSTYDETIEVSPSATLSQTQRTLIPLTEWPKHYAYPPLGGLRHLVFHAKENGFEKCIRRVGRRILIDPALYHQWVDEQNA